MAKKPVKFTVVSVVSSCFLVIQTWIISYWCKWLRIVEQVDAFTDSAFKGNPAAVCLLEEERDEDWLQALAMEFNISETCYLTRITEPESLDSSATVSPTFRLRWFTPVAEVSSQGKYKLGFILSHFSSLFLNFGFYLYFSFLFYWVIQCNGCFNCIVNCQIRFTYAGKWLLFCFPDKWMCLKERDSWTDAYQSSSPIQKKNKKQP